MAFEAARKSLHNWSSDRRLPSLSLKIDNVKTKFILFDNAVYSIIATLTYSLTSIFPRAAVTHTDEQIDNKFFKEFWRTFLDSI